MRLDFAKMVHQDDKNRLDITKMIKYLDRMILIIGTLALNSFRTLTALSLKLYNSFHKFCKKHSLNNKRIPVLKKTISSIPKTLNKLFRHADNIEVCRGEYTQETYLRKMESLCKCFSVKIFVFYFICLPIILLLTIVIALHYAKNRNTIAVTPSFMAPVVQENINIDEIDNIINQVNSPPMTIAAAKKRLQIASGSKPHRQLEYIALTVKKSVFHTAKKAGLSAKLIKKFIKIFNGEVNFATDVHDNDKIILLYKNRAAAGKGKTKVSNDDILAAELINHNKIHRAIEFTDSYGRTAYYSPKGVSLKPSLVRAPLNYSHISSRFSYHRWNPILGFYRAHLGVDFAAPLGTPVNAAGDGKVIFAGKKNGYGNVLIIRHDHKYSTLYAHLSHFAKKIRRGSAVRQNQLIGFIGNTGLSTGPHLHYEVRIYNIQRDPLSIKLPHFAIQEHKDRIKFFALAKTLLAQLHENLPHFALEQPAKKHHLSA